MTSLSERRKDHVIAGLLVLAVTLLMALTSDAIGFTRDEGYYFKAGDVYFGWFESLAEQPLQAVGQKEIDKHLEFNHEHPVLMKFLFSLSDGVLHKKLGLISKRSDALRFPAWVFSGICIALIYLLARVFLRRRASLLAALMFLSMPRMFWHGHLACFDIPVCAAHLWLVLAYVKGKRTWKGALVVGIAFGLAAATKHNVLVTPAFFVLHYLICEMEKPRLTGPDLALPKMPLAFFAMALLGPLVFIAHWPYLWPDIARRIGGYLGFHLHHEHYPILFFKDLLESPPFPVSFPFVMSALTIPVPILLLMLTGIVLAASVSVSFLKARFSSTPLQEKVLVPLHRADAGALPSGNTAILFLINAAFPFALIALPSSPIFGGTKHWMNALPFLCILGAWALEEGLARLEMVKLKSRVNTVLFFVFAALLVLPGTLNSLRVHPFGLSSYNALAGFTRGAASLGLQRTFWGTESRAALDEVNAKLSEKKSKARVHFGDTNRDSYRFYQKDKMLSPNIRWSSGVRGADAAIVQPQGEFKKQYMSVLNHWNRKGPDRVIHAEGVPLATVNYKERSLSKAPKRPKERP